MSRKSKYNWKSLIELKGRDKYGNSVSIPAVIGGRIFITVWSSYSSDSSTISLPLPGKHGYKGGLDRVLDTLEFYGFDRVEVQCKIGITKSFSASNTELSSNKFVRSAVVRRYLPRISNSSEPDDDESDLSNW